MEFEVGQEVRFVDGINRYSAKKSIKGVKHGNYLVNPEGYRAYIRGSEGEYYAVEFDSANGRTTILGYKENQLKPVEEDRETTKESNMGIRKCVSDVYAVTEDAVVVDKWAEKMGFDNDGFRNYLVIKANATEVLVEATRLEEESKK